MKLCSVNDVFKLYHEIQIPYFCTIRSKYNLDHSSCQYLINILTQQMWKYLKITSLNVFQNLWMNWNQPFWFTLSEKSQIIKTWDKTQQTKNIIIYFITSLFKFEKFDFSKLNTHCTMLCIFYNKIPSNGHYFKWNRFHLFQIKDSWNAFNDTQLSSQVSGKCQW